MKFILAYVLFSTMVFADYLPIGQHDHNQLLNTHGDVDTHIADTTNPHVVTATQIGVGSGDSPTMTGLALTGLTQCSVLFSGAGGIISQDNGNLCYDDVNDRFGIGTSPTHQFHVGLIADDNIFIDGRTNPRTITLGAMRQEHTAGIDGTRAYHVDVDSAGFDDTKGIVVRQDLSGSSATIRPKNISLLSDVTGATNYHLNMIEFDVVGDIDGSAQVNAIEVRDGMNPISHPSGAPVSFETAFKENGGFTNVTTEFSSGASNTTIFDSDNDYVYVGQATQFNDIDIILIIVASDPGINPTFEFSTGSSSWDTLAVTDGTNGFRENGGIIFSSPGTWVVDTVNGISNKFWVRIQRTTNTLSTIPEESTIRAVSEIGYSWDKDGDINIRNIVANGVTAGATTFNDSGLDNDFTVKGLSAPNAFVIQGSDGFAGIGTSTPTTELDVLGRATVNDGSGNIFINGGNATTPALENIAIGLNTLTSNSSGGNYNIAIGSNALALASNGSNNTAIGRQSLDALITGIRNVCMGNGSCGVVNSGVQNVSIGVDSLTGNRTGNSNTVVGYKAGLGVFNGNNSNNVLLGALAGDSVTSGSDNIIIGYNQDLPLATTSDHLNIGGLIYGDLASGFAGVGTIPTTALHVDSNAANTTAIQTLENTAGDVQIFRVDTNPEGSITASRGDIATGVADGEGVVFVKHTGDATNTGWKEFGIDHYADVHVHNNSIATVIDTTATPHLIQGLFGIEILDGFTFSAGSSGSITAFADAGGGQVTVTSASHGLSNGDVISISGTTDYNGVFVVANVTTNTYEITVTWVATQTGSWYEGDKLVADIGTGGVYKIDFYMYGVPAANNTVFKIEVYKNATVQSSIESKRKFSATTDIGTMTGGGIAVLSDGDIITLGLTNDTDSSNFTINHVNIVVHRL